ncbi:hypothetical protein F5B20DRAFT_587886 [Whalleya microplaca]|nr:hypothetical protein F5B20DRAFT_587886 [Whalleya microplaca]
MPPGTYEEDTLEQESRAQAGRPRRSHPLGTFEDRCYELARLWLNDDDLSHIYLPLDQPMHVGSRELGIVLHIEPRTGAYNGVRKSRLRAPLEAIINGARKVEHGRISKSGMAEGFGFRFAYSGDVSELARVGCLTWFQITCTIIMLHKHLMKKKSMFVHAGSCIIYTAAFSATSGSVRDDIEKRENAERQNAEKHDAEKQNAEKHDVRKRNDSVTVDTIIGITIIR